MSVIVTWMYLQLIVQSVPIITKIVSSNLAHGACTRYNIMCLMFARERPDITEILLKVALNTTTLTHNFS